MNLPERTKSKLLKDDFVYGSLIMSIKDFELILKDNKLTFFPEYTDHGIDHIENVIKTADAIISDEAWNVISPKDIATLIIACVLHDIGMHLTKDGFMSLMNKKIKWKIIPELSDIPWSVSWEYFLTEAKRFDGRTLTRLFGKTIPIEIIEKNDPLKWDENDLKLIGEFIRRNHHRLAHQIALNGFPGVTSETIKLKNLSIEWADLAGLIARSHGMPIRDTFKYLNLKFHNTREYQGIRPVFLMAVLRVADYLQVEKERAPNELLSIKKLRSPISQREWKTHDVIKDIRCHDDREALYIDAQPDNVEIFFRLKDLLNGLQFELDSSWAVLGEVYSRYTEQKLNLLGLTIRRISSNLDNETVFKQEITYLPIHAKFDTAGAELLKLLVKPLYGENELIGIRELIQNSVDAVNELKIYAKEKRKVIKSTSNADIEIKLKQKGKLFYLTITDRGIGMNGHTIRDYFLKAGASFRNSWFWKMNFIDGKNDQPKLIRSGRFGVGIFSTFLLGEKISVTTKHIDEEQGIQFQASIDDDFVELKKVESCNIGTTIEIEVSVKTAFNLYEYIEVWEWYLLEKPKIIRKIEFTDTSVILDYIKQAEPDSVNYYKSYDFKHKHLNKVLKPSRCLPPSKTKLTDEWRRINYKDYEDILWTYSDKPYLVCNGILISDSGLNVSPTKSETTSQLNENTGNCIWFRPPNCSIFDPKGNLPLNLMRTGLICNYPFVNELREDILFDYFAYLLIYSPEKIIRDLADIEFYNRMYYPGIDKGAHNEAFIIPLISVKKGMIITDSWLLKEAGYESALLCYSHNEAFDLDYWDEYSSFAKVLITKYQYGDIGFDHKAFIKEYLPGFDAYIYEKKEDQEDGAAFVVKISKNAEPSVLAKAWLTLFKTPYIPYSIGERKKMISNCSPKFKQYITFWENLKIKKIDLRLWFNPDLN